MNTSHLPHTDTVLAQLGRADNSGSGAFPADIPVGVTYARDTDYATRGEYAYMRDQGTPAYDRVEHVLARLEHGESARIYASGLAASVAVFTSLPARSRVVVPDVMYFGLTAWLRRFGVENGLQVVEVPTGDLGALRAAVEAEPTALVWVETPANPTWIVTDIAAAAAIAHSAGSVLAVDNTVATPVHCQPLTHGADIVMHSATKYLNGHDDVVAGVLVFGQDTDDPAGERLRALRDGAGLARRFGGAVLGGLETYLLGRGLRTLNIRMRTISANASALADALTEHPALERVAYPGLPSDPGYEVSTRQMTGGFSGMMSIFVKGGADQALQVANAARCFTRATSLGGTASLIEHRFTFEGPGSRSPENMLRLSIGLESVDDLFADLDNALRSVIVSEGVTL